MKPLDIFLGKQDRQNIYKDKYGRSNYVTSGLDSILKPTFSKLLKEKYQFSPEMPGGANFALLISHDIDRLTRDVQYTNRFGKLKSDLKLSHKPYQINRKIIDQHNSLERLIEWNEKNKIRSTYFVLNLTEEEADFNYSLEQILPILQKIVVLNNEIGLHGSHTAYFDKDKMNAELNGLQSVLPEKIAGYRNHYLRYDLATTTAAIDHCGFLYDSTLGYPDSVGFRNGVCHPFNFRSENGLSHTNFFEIPLVLMDTTLMTYMRYDFKSSLKIATDLMQEAIHCNGVFSMLMHNDSIDTEFMSIYEAIIDYAKQQGAWITTKKEYLDHWISKGYDKIMNSFIEMELSS